MGILVELIFGKNLPEVALFFIFGLERSTDFKNQLSEPMNPSRVDPRLGMLTVTLFTFVLLYSSMFLLNWECLSFIFKAPHLLRIYFVYFLDFYWAQLGEILGVVYIYKQNI